MASGGTRSKRTPESPAEALADILVDRGCDSLRPRVWVSTKKIIVQGLQYLAIEALLNEYSFRRASGRSSIVWEGLHRGRRIRILLGRGDEKYDCEVVQGRGGVFTWRDLEARLPDPPFPIIAVDLGLWRLHSEEELARLRIQLAMTLAVVRSYLWDRHLVLTSVAPEVRESLQELMGRNKAVITGSRPNEILWSVGAEEVIILRPDAPEDLTRDDVMRAQAFLIGGVVDLIPRRGVSRVLDRLVPWGKPRRITLRGSVIGVPDRINRVAEIILKARYEYGGDVEKAVLATMTKRDVMRRLFVEVLGASEQRGGRRVVRAEIYRELSAWLPISWEDFLEAARKARVEVVGS